MTSFYIHSFLYTIYFFMYKSIQGKIAQQHRITAGEERKVTPALRSVYAFLYTRVFYSKKKREKKLRS